MDAYNWQLRASILSSVTFHRFTYSTYVWFVWPTRFIASGADSDVDLAQDLDRLIYLQHYYSTHCNDFSSSRLNEEYISLRIVSWNIVPGSWYKLLCDLASNLIFSSFPSMSSKDLLRFLSKPAKWVHYHFVLLSLLLEFSGLNLLCSSNPHLPSSRSRLF